jgi:poly(ADP-ribose) glycohydrolase ARH3
METFDHEGYFRPLLAACVSAEYRAKIEQAAAVRSVADLEPLGNRIEALHSAPTAIASFALTPDSYGETIGNVIRLGGDTDTLAAMAGAISGAHLGEEGLDGCLVRLLETSPVGGAFLRKLAEDLFLRRGEQR